MILKKGDKGDDVRELQKLLDDNEFWTFYTITDYFGEVCAVDSGRYRPIGFQSSGR